MHLNIHIGYNWSLPELPVPFSSSSCLYMPELQWHKRAGPGRQAPRAQNSYPSSANRIDGGVERKGSEQLRCYLCMCRCSPANTETRGSTSHWAR